VSKELKEIKNSLNSLQKPKEVPKKHLAQELLDCPECKRILSEHFKELIPKEPKREPEKEKGDGWSVGEIFKSE